MPTAGVQTGGRLLFSVQLLFNLPKAPGVESKGAQRDPLQVWGVCASVTPGVSGDPLPQSALRAEVGLGDSLIGWGGGKEWLTSVLSCPSGEEGKAKCEARKPNSQILFVFFYFFVSQSLCSPSPPPLPFTRQARLKRSKWPFKQENPSRKNGHTSPSRHLAKISQAPYLAS